MFALIREWESSGILQKQFILEHGIARSTFGYWRRKYLKETSSGKPKEGFIPVNINSCDKGPKAIALFYPNGIRLVCSADMDLSRLKPLIVL